MKVAVTDVSFSLGGTTFGPSVTGLFEITNAGVAGSLTTTTPITIGDPSTTDFGVYFSADATIAFNTSNTAVNDVFNLAGGGTATLSAPAGPYFGVTLTLNALKVYVASTEYDLAGTFVLEQTTVNGSSELVIAATNVSLGTASNGIQNGSGALIITSKGIVGRIDATVVGSYDGFSGGATVTIAFNTDSNTSDPAVQQTITIGGHTTLVNGVPTTVGATTIDVALKSGAPIPSDTWSVSLGNVSIDLGGFATLTASDLTILSNGPDGSTTYSGTNVELFFGDGPYRVGGQPTGALNPDAIGLLIDATTFEVIVEQNKSFAIVASGSASLVGLDGLTLTTGAVNVRINTTGAKVLDFTSAAFVEQVSVTDMHLNAAGIVDLGGSADVHAAPERAGRRRHPDGDARDQRPDLRSADSGLRLERRRALLVRWRPRLPARLPAAERRLDLQRPGRAEHAVDQLDAAVDRPDRRPRSAVGEPGDLARDAQRAGLHRRPAHRLQREPGSTRPRSRHPRSR